MTKTYLFLLTLFLFCGCASSYRSIHPVTLHYTSQNAFEGGEFSYRYDILRDSRNKKYAKKEHIRGVKLIAVKIENKTNSMINVENDISFFSGQREIIPMEPVVIKNTIKQSTPTYLFYMLLTPLKLYTSNGSYDQTVNTYSIGYFLGPLITIYNLAVSGTSNKNLLEDLNYNNILKKNIQPGETAYGILGFRDIGYDHLTIKMTNN